MDIWPYSVDLGRDYEVEESDVALDTFETAQKERLWTRPMIQWSPDIVTNDKDPRKLKISRALIGTYGAGQLYLRSRYPNVRVVGHILAPFADTTGGSFDRSRISNRSCPILVPEDEIGTLVVAIGYEVPPEHAFEWTKVFFEHIEAERYVLLGSFGITEYQSADADMENVSPPLLRGLDTLHQLPNEIQHLESPNIASGVIAAALAHCIARRQHATALLSLEESSMGSSVATIETLTALHEGLNRIAGQAAKLGVDVLAQQLREHLRLGHGKTLLYI
ncbi:uncharacterized protein BJ171DRAFT_506446 [Polychytrium aggregatum]|uniref:uncharacterized protein n=1 Tax=Polychytrium aggregatum TaxID=110093 RepID=UPI0022FE9987|nr:uncharacterized protein BJ171DRAFT_506446 [Polychytrium aggregatum]KAI9204189.1 hypothetical protein BJ171DRAFT_506446 [Polychytrium aggregatum]